jgi:hypothetical protein
MPIIEHFKAQEKLWEVRADRPIGREGGREGGKEGGRASGVGLVTSSLSFLIFISHAGPLFLLTGTGDVSADVLKFFDGWL